MNKQQYFASSRQSDSAVADVDAPAALSLPISGSHDLRLGDWGPYSKRYMGLSHIADHVRGWRFDICAAPGYYRRRKFIPNVRWECGYHPWECSPDLQFFTHRHELEWKDKVYCDISFCPLPGRDNIRLMRCACVNNTERPQSLVLHLLASLQFPPHHPVEAQLQAGARWHDALDYQELVFATPRPRDTLCYDAMRRGEFRSGGLVNASGIGQGFGRESGDRISFSLNIQKQLCAGALLLRYRLPANETLTLSFQGLCNSDTELRGTGDFATLLLSCGHVAIGDYPLSITSRGSRRIGATAAEMAAAEVPFPALSGIELDGLVVGEEAAVRLALFIPASRDPLPEIIQTAPDRAERSVCLRYPGIGHEYALWWSEGSFQIRQHFMREIENLIHENTHNHLSHTFHGEGEGHYLDIFIRPLPIAPGETRIVHALIATTAPTSSNVGAHEAKEARCTSAKSALTLLATSERSSEALEAAYATARNRLFRPSCLPEGETYRFSQGLMAATTLSNCVYPAYAKGRFIRHHTPGRWWDSLYTWDSGFVGLGLLELDIDRAIDNLNAYLTEPGDPECAFVHHGTPVPVQIYLFKEIWSRTCDQRLLAYFYPRVKQYHEFLAGRAGSSNTRKESGLLSTWSYFYNSGGWDDYPAQEHFHENRKRYPGMTPACNSAHAIRTAKILFAAATQLGLSEDLPAYEDDIRILGTALQRHSWDEEAGCFSYVVHDPQGRADSILRHASGLNFNLGLDGIMPLVAGICTPQQTARILSMLRDPLRLWTDCGISTVDQSAPYYRKDGYWNGAVWFPHQWFFWKSALDHGDGELAWRIAHTAINLWKGETDASYNCFEHFTIASGRGAGWHHFGGLSTPVLSWFSAYFRPGIITGGHDCWVHEQEFATDNTSMRARLTLSSAIKGMSVVIVCLGPKENCRVRALFNNRPAAYREIIVGTYEISLPSQGVGCLDVGQESVAVQK